MSDLIVTVWFFGLFPACALSAWLNRYVHAPDSALYMCAIWPVVMIYAAFHIAFSGGINPEARHD